MVPGGGQQDTGPSWRTGEQRTGWCLDRVSPAGFSFEKCQVSGLGGGAQGQEEDSIPGGSKEKGLPGTAAGAHGLWGAGSAVLINPGVAWAQSGYFSSPEREGCSHPFCSGGN